MGLFQTRLAVWNPAMPGRKEEFELWVDTGAAYSWLSRKRLEALGVEISDRMQFRTIEGRTIERDVAPVFLRHDGRTGGDTVVLAEDGDVEVMGAHTLESLGLMADPVQKKLVPTIGLALLGSRIQRASRVVGSIRTAINEGRLREPFSNEDFRKTCPGFGKGTYNAFLWKHSRGNPGGQKAFFEKVGANRFCLIQG
jgi:predicted aspartyl protease